MLVAMVVVKLCFLKNFEGGFLKIQSSFKYFKSNPLSFQKSALQKCKRIFFERKTQTQKDGFFALQTFSRFSHWKKLKRETDNFSKYFPKEENMKKGSKAAVLAAVKKKLKKGGAASALRYVRRRGGARRHPESAKMIFKEVNKT